MNFPVEGYGFGKDHGREGMVDILLCEMRGWVASPQCQASVTWRIENGESLPGSSAWARQGVARGGVGRTYVANWNFCFQTKFIFGIHSVWEIDCDRPRMGIAKHFFAPRLF